MKKTVLIFLVLLAGLANAQFLESKNFQISFNEDGTAKAVETYHYGFLNAAELNSFKEAVEKNGSSLFAWQAYDARIFPHFGTQGSIANTGFVFDPEQKVLILEYDIEKQVAVVVSEDARSISMNIPRSFFENFDKGSVVVIPREESIEIVLPKNSEGITGVPEEATVQGNSIVLQNISSSNIDIKFIIPKPIAKIPDAATLIQEFFSNELNLFTIAVLLVVLIALYANRKKIGKSVEEYIVEHSELAPREEEIEVSEE